VASQSEPGGVPKGITVNKLWANLHGGSTHFPIALMIASVLFDALAFLVRAPYKQDPQAVGFRRLLGALAALVDKRDLHAAGFYTLLLGALASLVAVLSGMVISAWLFFGQGTLAKHHDFVWPAFGLMIGLAVWRLFVRDEATRPAFGVYLVVAAVTAGLMAAAGYYGGEMLGGD